jgi:hypothetical protein
LAVTVTGPATGKDDLKVETFPSVSSIHKQVRFQEKYYAAALQNNANSFSLYFRFITTYLAIPDSPYLVNRYET